MPIIQITMIETRRSVSNLYYGFQITNHKEGKGESPEQYGEDECWFD